MLMLIAGLVVFLGLHSSRIFAENFRAGVIASRGEGVWKGIYSVLSISGFLLIVYGYGEARLAPIALWYPPVWTRHVAALLTLFAFILLAAAYIPKNPIKAKLAHPMLLGTKVWAASHLLANGNVADVLLFGSFLVWAILCFRAAKKRDRAVGSVYQSGPALTLFATVGLGILLWAAFAFYLHAAWIGVRPFG
ncbi:MAG: NnrU family protein [Rhodocyclaceae bacterium]|nr:NnrU family protein [Rhodocyclaceae bacterium]